MAGILRLPSRLSRCTNDEMIDTTAAQAPLPGRERAWGEGAVLYQNASPGTRTWPSMMIRAERDMTALVTAHSPSTCRASAPTRKVPEG